MADKRTLRKDPGTWHSGPANWQHIKLFGGDELAVAWIPDPGQITPMAIHTLTVSQARAMRDFLNHWLEWQAQENR